MKTQKERLQLVKDTMQYTINCFTIEEVGEPSSVDGLHYQYKLTWFGERDEEQWYDSRYPVHIEDTIIYKHFLQCVIDGMIKEQSYIIGMFYDEDTTSWGYYINKYFSHTRCSTSEHDYWNIVEAKESAILKVLELLQSS